MIEYKGFYMSICHDCVRVRKGKICMKFVSPEEAYEWIDGKIED